jgi:hypothetical protein
MSKTDTSKRSNTEGASLSLPEIKMPHRFDIGTAFFISNDWAFHFSND